MPNHVIDRLRRLPPLVACVVVALGASTCPYFGLVGPACACSPPVPLVAGIVFGTVTTAAGGPAAGAQVTLQGLSATCAPGTLIQVSPVSADAAGRYSGVLMGQTTANSVCVRVVARQAGAATPYDSAVVVGGQLHVAGIPTDSVRVDLKLP